MNKTVNINLGNRAFTIDDDAYELLSQYLEAIKHVYRNQPDAEELADDIETRAAELLEQKLASGNAIITLDMVKSVIDQIGQPQDFEDDMAIGDAENIDNQAGTTENQDTQGTGSSTCPPPPFPADNIHVKKRFFRDPSNKLLAGVCSGIAAYLNADPTWIRLAVVCLCFLSFYTAAVIYLVLWIIIPEARTAVERMQMNGENPTFDNIGKTVKGMFKGSDRSVPPPIPNGEKSGGKRFADTLSQICAVIAKVILILIGIICAPVVLGLFIILIILISVLTATGIFGLELPGYLESSGEGSLLLFTAIGLVIAVGIPLFSLLYTIFAGSRRMSRPLRVSLLTAWAIGLVLAVGGIIAIGNTRTVKHLITDEEEYVMPVTDTDSVRDTLPGDSITAVPHQQDKK